MAHIQELAPTITDALLAVEQGCRRMQGDPHFFPVMTKWLTIGAKNYCMGCLATATFMQLSNKTGIDILNSISPNIVCYPYEPDDRTSIFDIQEGNNAEISEFHFFEVAIDSLRHDELFLLLKFYGLDKHKNAEQAIAWLRKNNTCPINYYTTKKELLPYADFLKDQLIPKIQELIN